MEQECGARIYLLPTSDFCQDLFTFALSIIFYRKNMDRTIITVVGKDTVGIIAKVCTWLADNNVNILDITQTIVQGYFNMMMIVDMEKWRSPSNRLSMNWMKWGGRWACRSSAREKKYSTRCTASDSCCRTLI